MDFFTVDVVQQELIGSKLHSKVGCGNGNPGTVGGDNLLVSIVQLKDTISFYPLIKYITIRTKIGAAQNLAGTQLLPGEYFKCRPPV
jgi:hypothetical protein